MFRAGIRAATNYNGHAIIQAQVRRKLVLNRCLSDKAGEQQQPRTRYIKHTVALIALIPVLFVIGYKISFLGCNDEFNSLKLKYSDKWEEELQKHPTLEKLRKEVGFKESRPHLSIHPRDRIRSYSAGALVGENKSSIPALVMTDGKGEKGYVLVHFGKDVQGLDGGVHHGMLATLIDEGLARTCFQALPHQIGVTAFLRIKFTGFAPTDSFYILRAHTTKVEGRKAFVSGTVETMPATGEPVTVCTAEALFVEPKQAKYMPRIIHED